MTQVLEASDQIKFVRSLLGIPYTLNGKSPEEGFDCWSLTRFVQEKVFGRQLPEAHIEDDSVACYIKAMMEGRDHCGWVQTKEPIHGCVVELTMSKYPHHCGTYIDLTDPTTKIKAKGLLHSLKGSGVIFDPWNSLKAAGWRRFTYNVPRSS
jgi:cell wall-associated NlpC family hydrolase